MSVLSLWWVCECLCVVPVVDVSVCVLSLWWVCECLCVVPVVGV